MSEARSQIGFDQSGLGTFLKSYQLEVPPNQREYAWTEEVTELFRDYSKALSEDTDYFLGTIVTIPRDDGTLEVVDGQQRLATTALLLAAMRDHLQRRGETMLVEAINNDFLTGIDRPQRARIPKLKLNVDDNDLFKAIVVASGTNPLPDATRPSHHRLIAAFREAQQHVRKIVAPFDDKDHGDVLERWVSFIQHRALAVLLKVPDDADAYKMFETLNDRGLRTSQADLVKNYLFGKSGNRITEVQSRWAYMRGTLEALDEEDITITFLRHSLVVLRGYLSAAEVYDAVQDIARANQSTVTFAAHLESLAPVYVATFNPENERWNDYPPAVRAAIEVFNLLNIRPMRALLLAISAKMDKSEAAKAFQHLISVGVRLLIAATIRSGSVETPLSIAAKDIFDVKIQTSQQLKAQLKALTPSDAQFREAFERARVSSARLGRYYLRSLEMAARAEREPWFIPQSDRSVINLEHVLPQKPEGQWPQFSDEEVAQYVNRLGNLVLLQASDNSTQRSASFAAKKQVYGRAPYLLTKRLADLDHWTTASILERQNYLAELAVTTWPGT